VLKEGIMSGQAIDSFETEGVHGADATRCIAASLATATLMVLSWLNALHSPAFDCIKASAMTLRARRALCAATLRADHAPSCSPLLRSLYGSLDKDRT
jgi:hypothetical protein